MVEVIAGFTWDRGHQSLFSKFHQILPGCNLCKLCSQATRC